MKTYTLKVVNYGVRGTDGSNLGMDEDGIFWMEVKLYDENGNWVGTEEWSTEIEIDDCTVSGDGCWAWDCSLGGDDIESCIFDGDSDYGQLETIFGTLWDNIKKEIYELKVAVGGDIVS